MLRSFRYLWIAFWGLFSAGLAFADGSNLESASHALQIRDSLQRQYQTLWDGMSADAKAGYRHLVDKVYLPADFDEEVLQKLDTIEYAWNLSDVQLESKSRANTWTAYGLAPRPDDPTKPLQYVVTDDKQYVMNCFACHGGNL